MQRKSLVAAAVLAACFGARAEDSYVEVYGILDVGVATVAHSLPANPDLPAGINPLQTSGITSTKFKRVTAFVNGGMQYSRLGVKASHEIAGGVKAIAVLEAGINPQSASLTDNRASVLANAPNNGGTANSSSNSAGSVNGQIFGRQAYVGVSEADWGTLTFGRNYNQIYDVMSAYDPVFKSDIMSPLGLSGTLGGGGGITENTRIDTSIKYKNKFGPVNVGALYKIGNADGSAPGHGYALNFGYEIEGFGVQAVYEAFQNVGTLGISKSTATYPDRATVTVYDIESFLIAAKYKTGEATVRGGWETYTLKKPSDAPTGSYDYFGTNAVLAPTGTQMAVAASTASDQVVNVIFAGGDYNFTPSFNLAAGAYDVHYKAFDSTKAGDIYWYSLVGDFKFNKETDVYGGLVYINYSGDKYSAATYKTNSLGMVGIRHKF